MKKRKTQLESQINDFEHTTAFMSIIQTAKQNGRSPPEVLRKILLTRGKKQTLQLLGVGAGSRRRGRPRRVQWAEKSTSLVKV